MVKCPLPPNRDGRSTRHSHGIDRIVVNKWWGMSYEDLLNSHFRSCSGFGTIGCLADYLCEHVVGVE